MIYVFIICDCLLFSQRYFTWDEKLFTHSGKHINKMRLMDELRERSKAGWTFIKDALYLNIHMSKAKKGASKLSQKRQFVVTEAIKIQNCTWEG